MIRFDVHTHARGLQRQVRSRELHRVLRESGLSNKDSKAIIAWCIQNPTHQYDRRGVVAGIAEEEKPAPVLVYAPRQFVPPKGHEKCGVSSCIADATSFGTGELDEHGFWEHGCYACARAYEQQFPEYGECWPFSEETLARAERNAGYADVVQTTNKKEE